MERLQSVQSFIPSPFIPPFSLALFARCFLSFLSLDVRRSHCACARELTVVEGWSQEHLPGHRRPTICRRASGAKRRYYSPWDVMRREVWASEAALVTLLTDRHLSNALRERSTPVQQTLVQEEWWWQKVLLPGWNSIHLLLGFMAVANK